MAYISSGNKMKKHYFDAENRIGWEKIRQQRSMRPVEKRAAPRADRSCSICRTGEFTGGATSLARHMKTARHKANEAKALRIHIGC